MWKHYPVLQDSTVYLVDPTKLDAVWISRSGEPLNESRVKIIYTGFHYPVDEGHAVPDYWKIPMQLNLVVSICFIRLPNTG